MPFTYLLNLTMDMPMARFARQLNILCITRGKLFYASTYLLFFCAIHYFNENHNNVFVRLIFTPITIFQKIIEEKQGFRNRLTSKI